MLAILIGLAFITAGLFLANEYARDAADFTYPRKATYLRITLCMFLFGVGIAFMAVRFALDTERANVQIEQAKAASQAAVDTAVRYQQSLDSI